jgi:hypothetical protein
VFAHSSSRFDEALKYVKDLVRVAANTSAWIEEIDYAVDVFERIGRRLRLLS